MKGSSMVFNTTVMSIFGQQKSRPRRAASMRTHSLITYDGENLGRRSNKAAAPNAPSRIVDGSGTKLKLVSPCMAGMLDGLKLSPSAGDWKTLDDPCFAPAVIAWPKLVMVPPTLSQARHSRV